MKFFAPIILCVLCFAFNGSKTAAQKQAELRSTGSGIEIDADGTVVPLSKEKSAALGQLMEKILEPVPDDLNKSVPLRRISLKKLDAQIKKIVEQYEVFPDSIRYFGGLTSIKYIAVLPEENDLLLIGPAEGWKTDVAGNVVGIQSGRSVFSLEDFLSIFRAVCRQDSSRERIACSFEPAAETQTKLAKLHRQFTTVDEKNAGAYAAALQESYGKIPIMITGLPATSRFAKVLAAADFKMKRIALGLEPAQVRNIPSYVSLISGSRTDITSRFWLVPEYAPVFHDSKKLIYRLGGLKVKALSHEDYLSSCRNMKSGGSTDRAAVNWCSKFEENYDALAKSQPVFGELRNGMEAALVAALIRQENLLQKAGCKLNILTDESKLKLVAYPPPKRVAGESVRSKNGYSVIVACGGIEINPFDVLQNEQQLDSRIDMERPKLIQYKGDEWWSP